MLPNDREAQSVLSQIKRLGIRDVMPFFDHQVGLWAICQVKQVPRAIITLDNASQTEIQPQIMWWCRTVPDGRYRAPCDQDVNDVIAIVQRAEIITQKSKFNPNWLDDQMIQAEQAKTDKHKKRQDENLKYAIRHYKVQDDIKRSLT